MAEQVDPATVLAEIFSELPNLDSQENIDRSLPLSRWTETQRMLTGSELHRKANELSGSLQRASERVSIIRTSWVYVCMVVFVCLPEIVGLSVPQQN